MKKYRYLALTLVVCALALWAQKEATESTRGKAAGSALPSASDGKRLAPHPAENHEPKATKYRVRDEGETAAASPVSQAAGAAEAGLEPDLSAAGPTVEEKARVERQLADAAATPDAADDREAMRANHQLHLKMLAAAQAEEESQN